MRMKIMVALCFLLLLMTSLAAAALLRVIPYPPGLDIKSEGASSAPEEINHSDSPYYAQPDFFEMKPTKTLTILRHYPTYQQTRENTCGPAAALTVLYYYKEKKFTEMDLAKGMRTQPYPIGTNPKDMVRFFEDLDWHVESSLDGQPFRSYQEFRGFVLAHLKKKTPILVENVEWGGHWRVIVGYDTMGTESTLDDVLIMADPYDTSDHCQDGYAVNNGERFFAMWFDHSMLPEGQREQPWIVARPK